MAERLKRLTCNPEAPISSLTPEPLLIGNLSTRRSWYHGRQPEVFLQHDSHCACQDVLEQRSRTRVLRLKPEVQILGSSKSIRHTKVEILHLKSCFLR